MTIEGKEGPLVMLVLCRREPFRVSLSFGLNARSLHGPNVGKQREAEERVGACRLGTYRLTFPFVRFPVQPRPDQQRESAKARGARVMSDGRTVRRQKPEKSENIRTAGGAAACTCWEG